MTSFVGDIEKLTVTNTNFRKVVFTGQHTQLVLMSLDPNEDIGMEVHEYTDQFFRVDKGEGKVVINGKSQPIKDGTAIVIPAGTKHNIVNTSSKNPLKLYTLYSPPHHKDKVVHKTKKIAEADTTDHL